MIIQSTRITGQYSLDHTEDFAVNETQDSGTILYIILEQDDRTYRMKERFSPSPIGGNPTFSLKEANNYIGRVGKFLRAI